MKTSLKSLSVEDTRSPCSEQTKSCESSSCDCQEEICGETINSKEEHLTTQQNIRQRKQVSTIQNQSESLEHRGHGSGKVTSLVDRALVAGIILSLFTIITLLLYVGFGKSGTNPTWQ